MMTTREILEKSKAQIEKPEKWWNRNTKTGKNCAETAIMFVAGCSDEARDARKALAKAMGWKPKGEDEDTFSRAISFICSYNDKLGRTHDEIMKSYDRAIEES